MTPLEIAEQLGHLAEELAGHVTFDDAESRLYDELIDELIHIEMRLKGKA